MPAGSVIRRPAALVPVLTVALAAACWFVSLQNPGGDDRERERDVEERPRPQQLLRQDDRRHADHQREIHEAEREQHR